MKHINEIELIEYVSGRLPTYRHKEVQEHISTCHICNQKRQEIELTWHTLAQWDVDMAQHGIADNIQDLAGKSRYSGIFHLSPRKLSLAVFRVAASIIIGISFGYLMGNWYLSKEKPKTEVAVHAPKYVDVLSLEWSTGFVQSELEEK